MPTPFNKALQLKFLIHSGFQDLESVFGLLRWLDRSGLHPQQNPGIETSNSAEGIESILEGNYRDFEARDGTPSGGVRRMASCRIVADGFPQAVASCHFTWLVALEDGREEVEIKLNGVIDSWTNAHEHLYQHLALRLLETGRQLWPVLRPSYGYIEDFEIETHPFSNEFDPYDASHDLVTLSWANFFGPGYISKYGRDLLSNIPGHSIESLADGGILYRSRERILVKNELRHRRWQKEVQQYLAQCGVSVRFDFTTWYD